MTTGVFSASIAVVSSTLTGLLIDFAHKPAFGTITKSMMEFAVLGRIPGTHYFINFNNLILTVAVLALIYMLIKLYKKLFKMSKSFLDRPHPVKFFGRLF